MQFRLDIKQAIRSIRLNPGFSVIAIATLGFGIGANTAIFSVFDQVLIRPLGYGEEGRLVTIHESVPRFSHLSPRLPVNAMHFLEWRKSVAALEAIAMIGDVSLNLTGGGDPERLAGARVSSNLFPMLGARTRLGRTFLEEEDAPGRDRVVVITDGLWRRRFGADRGIIGRKITLDGQPYEVVGALAPSFHFPKLSDLYAMTIAAERPEIWKPFAVRPGELELMGDFNYAAIGRLRRGVSMKEAGAQLNAVQEALARRVPEKVELAGVMVPLQEQITYRSRQGLELLLGAAGVVLLIGCVNIANLLLVRATSRKRELAIRSAMGAGVWDLVRQTLAESLLLGILGGAAGALLAYAALQGILAGAPVDIPRLDEVRLDGRILLFTTALSVVAGLVFGLLPAWRLARTDPQEAMRSGGRGSTEGRGAGRLRLLLVSVEVGLSTVCLIAGALLVRSFVNLMGVDRGFVAENVLTVPLKLPGTRYGDSQKRTQFSKAMLEEVGALAGVASAGVVNKLPLGGEGGNNLVSVEGTTVPFSERPLADIRGVNPAYFAALGIGLRQGRVFAEADGDHRVGVVSALAAERLWPGERALGQRFKVGDPEGPFIDVVGVVNDVKSAGLDKAASPTVYLPYWQRRTGDPSLVVKSALPAGSVAAAVRDVIRRIDPELPVPEFRTMEEMVDSSVAQRRFQMNLLLVFGAAALLLACLGVYGVVSYSVSTRTNEMGIRMAVGAGKADILGLVLRETLAPVMAGLGAGIAVSLVAGRVLAGMLYGVTATDGATMTGVVLVLAVFAAAAGLAPAVRATRVDPVTALRWE